MLELHDGTRMTVMTHEIDITLTDQANFKPHGLSNNMTAHSSGTAVEKIGSRRQMTYSIFVTFRDKA